MSLLFNMLSRLVIAFLPRSKHLLISWLKSSFAVILEPTKIKYLTASIISPYICHEVIGPDAMIFVFWMLSFKPTLSLSYFTFIKRLFSSSSMFLYIRLFKGEKQCMWYLCMWPVETDTTVLKSGPKPYQLCPWAYWYFSRQSWFQLVLPPAQGFSWCTLHIN